MLNLIEKAKHLKELDSLVEKAIKDLDNRVKQKEISKSNANKEYQLIRNTANKRAESLDLSKYLRAVGYNALNGFNEEGFKKMKKDAEKKNKESEK